MKKHRPLGKEALLPLAIAKVHSLSLHNHLALATLCSGQGSSDQLMLLLKSIYLAYFLRGAVEDDTELDLYRRAAAAIDTYAARAQSNQTATPTEEERTALMRLLAVHDAQLAAVKRYRYLDAWDALQRSLENSASSPIPANV